MAQARVIDGVALARDLTDQLKSTIAGHQFERAPCLATVLVGDNAASAIYVANKRKKAEEIGITSIHHHLPETSSTDDLLKLIGALNRNPQVDSILIQLPLPKHVYAKSIIQALDPKKDCDGFHPTNLGFLVREEPEIIPCTPLAILHIIQSVSFSIKGKHAVVVGRSNIVGKPAGLLLLQGDATVTICHKETIDLSHFTRQADLLVVAAGHPRLINRSNVKKGAFVIDVGINRDEKNKICGDVDFADVVDVASYITPVPGGVGPLTIAMLLKNTVDSYLRSRP
ncbi:MAG TPA: bifunctional methylenetetrahydrofolate dehydrogenase/methenyltetrahydrofolate cyclohydrolase FolD [Myxococcota bacterium]|nr:bifunctional methylenetetrahydrofolate dehydrogenase/methenyltetrahydrofolate cyclohydrolase FolD [Myxococcota bacterium]